MLDFEDQKDFFDGIVINDDPWRLILDDVFMLKPSNASILNSHMDIWMTPEICNSFLLAKDKTAKVYLSQIHKQCRHKDPEKRPSATQLLRTYKDLQLKLQMNSAAGEDSVKFKNLH